MSVVPSNYRLTIAVDLEQERFEGTALIDVSASEEVSLITLHSDRLTIGSALVRRDSATIAVTPSLDAEREELTLHLDEPLSPGAAVVEIEFSGALEEDLVGFYLSRFEAPDGSSHTLAATQFEAPYARRCFPCWDEPSFKATFDVSLLVDPSMEAIANGAEIGRTVIAEGPYAGRLKVDFAPTIPMSTYLVAFIVGPLEAAAAVDVDGVALRVVHPLGSNSDLTAFALEAGAFALRYFTDYFGLPYPGTKLDLVALPDFAFGAMENLGCVTFREVLLLVDPNRATRDELQRVTDVINHEIAHMWFGDLVTMKWWNGLWLNEAFATFMEMKCTDAFRPEWDRWVDFSLSSSAAYDTDALRSTRPIEYEVNTPAEAEGMFDVLTYEKGAAVVRMLEQYLGEDPFREGIRHYMVTHQLGNAETTDLWDALEETTSEPVRQIMDSWIFQGGYPTISATTRGGDLALSQARRLPLTTQDDDEQNQRWSIPFTCRWSTSGVTEPAQQRVLLDEPTTLKIGNDVDWWIGNADRNGFFRMLYTGDHLEHLADIATSELSPVERYGLVDDTWAGVLTGDYATTTFLNLLEAMTAETDRSVWVRMIKGFDSLHRLVDGDAVDRLEEVVHDAVAPNLARLGLAPIDDEADAQRQLRGDLIKAMGLLAKDPEIHGEAQRTVSVGRRDPDLVEISIFAAAVSVTASIGDDADFDDFVEAWKNASNPQDEVRFLYALADFPDPEHVERVHAMVLDGSIRAQNAPFLLQRSMMSRTNGRQTWEFITQNWDRLLDLFATSLITRMIGTIPYLDRAEDVVKTERFLAENKVPSGQQTVTQLLEKQRINAALRQRESAALSTFLNG